MIHGKHTLLKIVHITYTILNTYQMAAVQRRRRSLTGSNPRWSDQVDINYQRLYVRGHEDK